jgi:hypothetical protein
MFTVTGMNFGRGEEMGVRNVRIGDTACFKAKWVSDSVMMCKALAGVGLLLTSAVTVAGDISRLYPLSKVLYIVPCISNIPGH